MSKKPRAPIVKTDWVVQHVGVRGGWIDFKTFQNLKFAEKYAIGFFGTIGKDFRIIKRTWRPIDR